MLDARDVEWEEKNRMRRQEIRAMALDEGMELDAAMGIDSSSNRTSSTEHGTRNVEVREGTRMRKKKYDLQDRLVDYAVGIIKLSEALPDTKAGKHVCVQILRSGTAPAPNYSEAQGAESRADFIHKLKVALKELRETEAWLKIVVRAKMHEAAETIEALLRETDELISILFKSVDTAKKNLSKR